MQNLSNCPICESNKLKQFIKVKDHSVSKEDFTIVECESCGFKFTTPRPGATEIGKYYQSEDYVSHNDSNKGFINSIYQLVKKYTLWKKLNLVVQISGKKTGKILDYGCGTGDFIKINTHNSSSSAGEAYSLIEVRGPSCLCYWSKGLCSTRLSPRPPYSATFLPRDA